MSYIKNTFIQFKEFIIGSTTLVTSVIKQLSITNLKQLFTVEYKTLKAQFADLKATNWNLAQYHLVAGNYNDAIMRFKILQTQNYRSIEAKYFLGRIYLEKNNFAKAKVYLYEYLLTKDTNYQSEAEYCLSLIKQDEISMIPNSIISNKRDRIALNLERSSIDIGLLNRYNAIIQILREDIEQGIKIFEVGCYIGILGRILQESFPKSIQYYVGSEIGHEAAEVARTMYFNDIPVYDKIELYDDISQLILNQNVYSIVLIPDILAYYSNLSHIFSNLFTSLKVGGIAIIVARVVKKDPILAQAKDIEFLHPIEEFRYSYDYVINLATSYGLQLKNSNDIGDGFELFIFNKV